MQKQQKWSLKSLYTSFDNENLKKDYKTLTTDLDEFYNWIKELTVPIKNPTDIIVEYIQRYSKVDKTLSRIYTYATLSYSVDTKFEASLNLMEKIENLFPLHTTIEVIFLKWLSSIDNLPELISQNELLKEHAYFLTSSQQKSRYLLSDNEEALIAHMKNTGSSAFSKLQQSLTSNLLVDIELDNEAKQLPLSVVRNLSDSKDSNIRKTAYEAELKAYRKIDTATSACLNAIKGEVITISSKKGYNSPLEMTLLNSRMDINTLNAMLTAIKEYLPTFRKYLKNKATRLGHSNGLPFYDLFAPIGESNLQYTFDEAKELIITNFNNFNKDLGNFAKHAFDHEWIDVYPREGKVGGAFCYNIHAISESRIMTNYTGSFNDVTTVAHELGHAYHGYCLKDVSIINSDYPMPLAETASIFCETIIFNSLLQNTNKEEKLTIIENNIMSSTQVIVDILSRYTFETNLFEQRKESSLSVDALNTLMINAQKEIYGDGLDSNYLHPYMWICKPHYYDPDHNFYNFPYAFGLLFAKGLYAIYLDMGKSFIEKYNALLTATGNHNIRDTLKIIGVDSHSVDFYRNSLELIKKDIDNFITL